MAHKVNENCIGCMSCTSVCNFDAIEVVDGLAKINKEKCTDCGACKNTCPVEAIEKDPEANKPSK